MVQPVGRQMLFVRDPSGDVLDGVSRLKKRGHIFRSKPRGEGENHDRPTEQKDFTGDTLLPQCL